MLQGCITASVLFLASIAHAQVEIDPRLARKEAAKVGIEIEVKK